MAGAVIEQLLKHVGAAAVALLCVVGVLAVLGVPVCVVRCGGNGSRLPEADTPPLEFAYLDAGRVAAYLGQAANGLATTEQRTKQLTQSVNATLSAGSAAQAGLSEQAQEGTTATITLTAADDFYTLLRLLREGGEAQSGKCRTGKPGSWVGKINDQAAKGQILRDAECIGVGNFVRIENAQLFLPPFAQALQRVQSANAFFGQLPRPRTSFTSPTQSTQVSDAIRGYEKHVGPHPRVPFVAAPYGSPHKLGDEDVTIFLPTQYEGITSEPSLLSGSVTIVGKIVYYAREGSTYIDYPTVSTFGKALHEASPAFLDDLGVCSEAPPQATSPQHRTSAPKQSTCTSFEATLRHVRESVSFKPPVVVVLPLAIYQ